MITKFSWLLYKRIMSFNKLLTIHYILLIPGMGYIPYLFFEKVGTTLTVNPTGYIMYFVFMAQTFLILGKRIKNEFFFSSRCYNIFPRKKMSIVFYTLLFGTIDINVVIQLIVVTGSIFYFSNWDLHIYPIFLIIFFLGELFYLSVMMVVNEFIIEKFGSSKNIFIIMFFPFLFFEFYARMAEKFYLIDYIPVSGWISSTVHAAQKGDVSQVLFYFCISIIGVLVGLLLLDKVYYPKKNNAF